MYSLGFIFCGEGDVFLDLFWPLVKPKFSSKMVYQDMKARKRNEDWVPRSDWALGFLGPSWPPV